MDIGDLDGASIQQADFKDKELEGLVRQLLKSERELRHRADAKIAGPVAAYRGDDLRDLIFTPVGAPVRPRHEFTAALTWDEQGEATWYSCKGGGSWKKSILEELGRAARNKALENEAAPSARTKKRPPEKLLEHLAKGGRYAFVVGVPAIDDDGLLEEVQELLAFWLNNGDWAVPGELGSQLHFFDANHLADFISIHQPSLTESQRDKLRLVEPNGLKPWSQWTTEHAVGRDLPEFQADPLREQLVAVLRNERQRICRVFGAPGVGKTRVVHEAIARSGTDVRDRVRYCDDPQVGLHAIEGPWLRGGAKPWLVLDEVRTHDADHLVAKFKANANERARLIMIGTADAQSRSVPGEQFELPQLAEPATRKLIETEAPRLSDAQREAIWRLSEGYPWYAVLLAQAVNADESVLDSGEDQATRWSSGAIRVLAGNPREYGGDENRWRREAELRAKALLVAMLTRDLDLDWETLWERHGEGLRLAIGEPTAWDEVRRRERDCRHRQLLRRSGLRANRRYVSPNNLARLVLNHFLTDPDLGPRIRRHTPELRETLLSLAKNLRVPAPVVERLALGEWDELGRRVEEGGVAAVEDYLRWTSPAYEAAQEAPERAAWTVSELVSRAGTEGLRSAPNLRLVGTHVFEHVIHRRITDGAFRAVESGLLTIARVDDSTFSNNAAGIWSSLFQPCLHLTHQSWPVRRALLEQRLTSDDPFVRGLAIDALGPAVDPSEQGLGYSDSDRVDGDWPVPSVADAVRQKEELWSRLLDACSNTEPALASRARSVVVRSIRGAIGWGLFVQGLKRLAEMVMAWSADQRLAMMESIANVRRYDMDDFVHLPELFDAFSELERALAPANLQDRVRAQFGSWHPGPLPINDPEREQHEAEVDLELARELLSSTADLEWALAWSCAESVPRAQQLWSSLGRTDRGGELLDRLAFGLDEDARADVLGRYLLGWANAASPAEVEAWLSSRPDRHHWSARRAEMLFVSLQDPTVARLNRLRELVDLGVLEREALLFLPSRGWGELEPQAVLAFLRSALRTGDLGEVVLRTSVRLLRAGPPDTPWSPRARDLLRAGLEQVLTRRVVIAVQDAVTDGARLLAEQGEYDFLARMVVMALSVESGEGRNAHLGQEMLSTLLRSGHGDALFPALADPLLRTDGRSLVWAFARENLLHFVSDSVVLEWIGENHDRGRVVASLTSPYSPQLDPIVVSLLRRFGIAGRVAGALTDRAYSTPRAIHGGVARFYEAQRDNARAWEKHECPEVRQWATRLAERFETRLREDEARREHRARYGS
ncbi:MAG: hypothetical protein ACE37F_02125 [Nannocystaceae bacterium]